MTRPDALNRLAAARDLTAGALAGELRTSMEASGMMLIRLMRQGLVVRELDAGIFIYNLTPKGHARRAFLNTRTSEIPSWSRTSSPTSPRRRCRRGPRA